MKDEKQHIAIALIGEAEVGKTSIIHLIDDKIEDRGTTFLKDTDDVVYTFWELQTSSYEPEGLVVFSKSFLNESTPYYRYLLIVSDSTDENVTQISYSLRYLMELFPKTRFAIIANKQDLPSRESRLRIEKMTHLPTLELIAIEENQRNKLVNFISYLLESESGL